MSKISAAQKQQELKKKIGSSSGSGGSSESSRGSGTLGHGSLYKRFTDSYKEKTPGICSILDSFLLVTVISGVIQFIYMLIMGSYPYNAFLSGFATSCGMFCNVANLRIQLHPGNAKEVVVSPERAYADFAFSSMVLFLFAVCFVG